MKAWSPSHCTTRKFPALTLLTIFSFWQLFLWFSWQSTLWVFSLIFSLLVRFVISLCCWFSLGLFLIPFPLLLLYPPSDNQHIFLTYWMAHQWSPFFPSCPPHQSIIFTANHGGLSKHELGSCLENSLKILKRFSIVYKLKSTRMARHAKPLQMINEGSSWLLVFLPIFLPSLCPLPT